MSNYREKTEVADVDFEDLECLKKLENSNKLTTKERMALHKLIQYYFSLD